jgi:hypothetical protein
MMGALAALPIFLLVFVSQGKAQTLDFLRPADRFGFDCSSFAMRVEDVALLSMKDCGYISSDGLIRINQETMDIVWSVSKARDRESNFPICLSVKGSFGLKTAYFLSDGRGRFSSEKHFPACDRFANGVFPTPLGGEVGYSNASLDIVHRTGAPFARKFKNGVAIVCSVAPDKQFERDKEHFKFVRGSCGLINETFEIVIPFEHDFQSMLLRQKNSSANNRSE